MPMSSDSLASLCFGSRNDVGTEPYDEASGALTVISRHMKSNEGEKPTERTPIGLPKGSSETGPCSPIYLARDDYSQGSIRAGQEVWTLAEDDPMPN